MAVILVLLLVGLNLDPAILLVSASRSAYIKNGAWELLMIVLKSQLFFSHLWHLHTDLPPLPYLLEEDFAISF